MSNYLEKKIKTKRYVVKAVKAQKENYNLKFNLLSSEVIDEGVLLTIGTEASFNYVGMQVQSGFGEISKMLFNFTDEGYILTDWFMPYDYYDEYTRGQVNNLNDINIKLGSPRIATKQAEIDDKLNAYYSIEREVPAEINSINGDSSSAQNITTNATITPLNKSAIATYAINNKALTTPASGGSNVPYYDFSQLIGNWDCTNFVSHALLAGGATVYDTNGSGISSTGWYYRNLSNRSSSWSGVINLHDFLISNNTKGPKGTSTSYTTFNPNNVYPYEVGDILQFYQSGSFNNWRHSTIITGYYNTSSSSVVLGALVAGRTSPGVYNNNQKASEIYPGENKRVIKLIGNYK